MRRTLTQKRRQIGAPNERSETDGKLESSSSNSGKSHRCWSNYEVYFRLAGDRESCPGISRFSPERCRKASGKERGRLYTISSQTRTVFWEDWEDSRFTHELRAAGLTRAERLPVGMRGGIELPHRQIFR